MSKGSVYKRKDDRFEARVYFGTDSDGKRVSKSFYGRSSEEAMLKLRKFVKPDEVYAETQMTVQELIFEWLGIMMNRIKESTYANYRIKAEKHLIPFFGIMNCGKKKAMISMHLLKGSY